MGNSVLFVNHRKANFLRPSKQEYSALAVDGSLKQRIILFVYIYNN
jgi:hypothetical protein